MNAVPPEDKNFATLARDIEAVEDSLRDRFTAVPPPSPATLRRIKASLHAEAVGLRATPARSSSIHWARSMGAIAAAVLLVVGARHVLSPNGAGQPVRSIANLDAFTASLPAVLADEDTEIAQIRAEVRQLESQAAGNVTDAADADDSAADRSSPTLNRTIADNGNTIHSPQIEMSRYGWTDFSLRAVDTTV